MCNTTDRSKEVEDPATRRYSSNGSTLFGIQRSFPFTSSSHHSRMELFASLNAGIQYRSPLIAIHNADQLDRLALVQIWDIWRTWQTKPRTPSFPIQSFVRAIFDDEWTTRQIPIDPIDEPLPVKPIVLDIGVIRGKLYFSSTHIYN